jgi:hypothetical protein
MSSSGTPAATKSYPYKILDMVVTKELEEQYSGTEELLK